MTIPDVSKLISWWSFNEVGEIAYDLVGDIDLQEFGGTIDSVDGVIAKGRRFIASHTETLVSFTDVTPHPELYFGDSDFTLGAWIVPASFTNNSVVIGSWNFDESYYGITLDKYPYAGIIRFAVSSNGSLADRYYVSAPALTIGQRYFVLGWHDSVNNKICIQVNNGTVYEANYALGINPNQLMETFCVGGAVYRDAMVERCYDGIIDEPFIYAGVLSASERTWLYNEGHGRSYFNTQPSSGGGFSTMF